MHFHLAAAIWGLATVTTVRCHASSLAPTAVIDSGPIFGTTTSLPGASATVNKFLGIEFAQSPPERFTPPKRPQRSTAARNATQFTASCTQQFVCKYHCNKASKQVLISAIRPRSCPQFYPVRLQLSESSGIGRLSLPQCLCPFHSSPSGWAYGDVLDLWRVTRVWNGNAASLRRIKIRSLPGCDPCGSKLSYERLRLP